MKLIARNWLTAAFIAASGAATLMIAPTALAQDAGNNAGARIALVNLDRLLRESDPAKAAQARLEQEFSKREKDINDADTALKTATDRLQRDLPTLSDSQRQQRQRQLSEMDRDLQRKRGQFQDDLGARKQEELQRILDRANQVVKQIAERDHYDLILQDAVYANPRLDITNKVITALGATK
jgi:outer membrane protein